jgi:hypothetical protein
VVKVLLDVGADKEAAIDGHTSLSLASHNGLLEVVKILLDAGADKEAKSPDGYTSLHLASQEGHPGVVKILLNAGADKDAKTPNGDTSLIVASQQGHAEVVHAMTQQSMFIRHQLHVIYKPRDRLVNTVALFFNRNFAQWRCANAADTDSTRFRSHRALPKIAAMPAGQLRLPSPFNQERKIPRASLHVLSHVTRVMQNQICRAHLPFPHVGSGRGFYGLIQAEQSKTVCGLSIAPGAGGANLCPQPPPPPKIPAYVGLSKSFPRLPDPTAVGVSFNTPNMPVN